MIFKLIRKYRRVEVIVNGEQVFHVVLIKLRGLEDHFVGWEKDVLLRCKNWIEEILKMGAKTLATIYNVTHELRNGRLIKISACSAPKRALRKLHNDAIPRPTGIAWRCNTAPCGNCIKMQFRILRELHKDIIPVRWISLRGLNTKQTSTNKNQFSHLSLITIRNFA